MIIVIETPDDGMKVILDLDDISHVTLDRDECELIISHKKSVNTNVLSYSPDTIQEMEDVGDIIIEAMRTR